MIKKEDDFFMAKKEFALKPIIHTYLSFLRDELCSMLVVPKGLKQGELEVPTRYLAFQQ
jgi:hypothetical protein